MVSDVEPAILLSGYRRYWPDHRRIVLVAEDGRNRKFVTRRTSFSCSQVFPVEALGHPLGRASQCPPFHFTNGPLSERPAQKPSRFNLLHPLRHDIPFFSQGLPRAWYSAFESIVSTVLREILCCRKVCPS